MLLGYARVSTDDQDLALQRAALREVGCRKIFEEKVSGANRARAELDPPSPAVPNTPRGVVPETPNPAVPKTPREPTAPARRPVPNTPIIRRLAGHPPGS